MSGGGSTNTLDMLRLSPSRGPVPPMDWIGRANAGSRLDLRPTGPRKLTRPAWSPTAAIRPYPSTAAKLWPRVRAMPRAPRLKLRAAKLPSCYATPVAGFGVRPCVDAQLLRGRFGTWRPASGGRGGPDAARTCPGRAPDAAGPVPDGRAPDDAGLPDEKLRTGHSPTDD